ncbi:ATP-binding cassette domain-containing protein [Halalkalicoccus tibetensis]|uniref:ATP-binding cassette domain-containing protein n=1 Tax=Halalkalicoccus tibetensis TaxID=175632 RepID=A0ABD5V6Y7_9EURY
MRRIEAYLNITPNTLSRGRQQRVALGRAIVQDPEAFLMDEPLSNRVVTERRCGRSYRTFNRISKLRRFT